MKNICLYLLLFLSLACKKEENFDRYNYNGAYPRKMDGSRIRTYSPEIHGGEIQVKFNGHSWNHTPYLSLHAQETNPPFTSSDKLSIGLYSLLTFTHIDPCVLESLFMIIPLKKGRLIFTDETGNRISTSEVGVQFISANCDATKDEYKLNLAKTSWIDVKQYDKTTRHLEAEFDLNFIIKTRNSEFGPIYPKEVNLKGKIKTVAKLFK